MVESEQNFQSLWFEDSSHDSLLSSMETPSGSPNLGWRILGSRILGGDEIHVWCACLDLDAKSVAVLARILSGDELRRAMRFRRSLDCQRFVAAHAILRLILGFYLDVEPARIALTRGRFGKPTLCLSDERSRLHFNLSHSNGLALYAVSRSFEVGIDVELIQPRLESLHLAEQFLLPEDVARLRRLLPPQRADAFFQAWTRMEARQKALGKGLALTPTDTTAPYHLQPSEIELAEAPEKATVFAENLPIRSGYAAALAVDGYGYTVRYLEWLGSLEVAEKLRFERPSR